jgi:hypothetical protein
MTVLERPPEANRTALLRVPEAIIPEARRRGRRRRAFWVLAAFAAAGALVAVTVVILPGARAILRASRSPLTPGARSVPAHAPAVVVAWGDYAGVLHLGDVATRRQLQIAAFPVAESSAGPVVFDRGRLFWVDANDRIRSVEIATGKASVVVRGTAVMATPNGARLYVDQGTTDFLELSPRTMRVTRRVALPAGWTANPWVARPVAGGLVLMHTGAGPIVLGIWRPGRKVRPLGAATDTALDIYTPPNGRYSLVAWIPTCANHNAGLGSGCPLAITNTATGRTVTVRSPTRYGFTRGAFSPDGTQLATYVNTDNPSDSYSTPRSELALVDTATGALRLDPEVNLITTEDAAWTRWLPPGRQLLTGAITATYLVNARSLATRFFYFDGTATRLDSITSSSDLNFSTIVVPPSTLSPKQRRSLDLTEAPKKAG